MRIHAWLEEREIAGLDPAFRGVVEVHQGSAYVTVGGGGSPAELTAVLDRILGELVGSGETPDESPSESPSESPDGSPDRADT